MPAVRDSLDQLLRIPTPSGRVWLARPADRPVLAQVGLLGVIMGVAAEEATRATSLLHMDADDREAELKATAEAMREDAAPNALGLAPIVSQYDELAAVCVVGVVLPGDATEHPVRLVLHQADEGEDAMGERIWVGRGRLAADIVQIGRTLASTFSQELDAGIRFRPETDPSARPS